MSTSRVNSRSSPILVILIGSLLASAVLAACGTAQFGASSVKLEATATDSYFGAFSFGYPSGWEAGMLDAPPGAQTFGWLEFVPPGESHEDIYILYSRGYEGLPTFWCSIDEALSKGHSFSSWADCIANAMRADGSYANISHRQANGGKIQIVKAQQGDRQKMWAFVYTKSFLGTITIGALTFSATPAKFDQYHTYVDSMMSSFRAK